MLAWMFCSRSPQHFQLSLFQVFIVKNWCTSLPVVHSGLLQKRLFFLVPFLWYLKDRGLLYYMYFYSYFVSRFLDIYKLHCNNIIGTSVFCLSKRTTSQIHHAISVLECGGLALQSRLICCGIVRFFLFRDSYFGSEKWHCPSRGTVT